MECVASIRFSNPQARKSCGVFFVGKNSLVAIFTDLSVACAESTTATSNWKTFPYSSSGLGSMTAARRLNNSAVLVLFSIAALEGLVLVAAVCEAVFVGEIFSFVVSKVAREPHELAIAFEE